jgi:quinohemoprotein ethanol dehydrogenase
MGARGSGSGIPDILEQGDSMRFRPEVLAPTLLFLLLAACEALPPDTAHPADSADSWLVHGHTHAEPRFSPLEGINRDNVDRLGLSWTYDFPLRGGVEATPLMADGVLYLTGPWSTAYALSARTGDLLWRHDPEVPRLQGLNVCCGLVNRGVALHDGKVFLGTLDGRLLALDQDTGEPVWEVQTTDPDLPYSITGAPRVVGDLVVIGNGGAEYARVRGYVSAYHAEDGDLAWRTYTVPGNPADGFESPAMEYAAETWTGEWWRFGGGGTAWDSFAYDPELDLLYVGVGNGGPWNRMIRSPEGGDNLFLASIMALRPETGELVWYYQTTPGESWDYTATQHMILADLEIEGEERQVLMQAPKNGFFYVLDRATGELISAEPFVPVNWASHVDMETGRPVEMPEARYEEAPFLMTPGILGGHNWHPMSYNPETGLVYIPARVHWFRYAHDEDFELREGELAVGVAMTGEPVPPATGHLLAWDPVAQQERWRVPHAGMRHGGTLSTAGGLVFQGRGDGGFAAYDAHDGTLLWEFSSGLGIIAPPITYDLDGVQYVTIAAGWSGPSGRESPPPGEAGGYEQRGRLMTFAIDHDEPSPPLTPRAARPDPSELDLPALELPDDPDSLEEGQALFQANCAACHGADGDAQGSMPSLQRMSPASHRAFHQVVAEGAREPLGMPGFGERLNDQEVTLIHGWLASRILEAAGGGNDR